MKNDNSLNVLLVVEDEINIREILVDELTYLGFIVHSASSGEEALDLLKSIPTIKLIITDIRLGGTVDGWQVARKAREIISPEIPIIYVTAYSNTPTDVLPNSILLKKPYSFTKLYKAIEEIFPDIEDVLK